LSAPRKIFSIPASAPFAEGLARGLIERLGSDPLSLTTATIYLPTRRAVRTLGEAFARVLGGAALLPEIKPLGDVDEDEFLFDSSADGFTLPPAIAPLRRRLLLAHLVLRWDERRGRTLTFAQASGLAASLATLMDEFETEGVGLEKLDTLAMGSLATHWAEVRDFLDIVRDGWPAILAAEAAINPADHRNRALHALAERLARTPPAGLVIAAGSTGSIPATADLLAVIARLPNGMVVLPGLDRTLDDSAWNKLHDHPGHPQFGLQQLLRRLETAREGVGDWMTPLAAQREAFLSEALRPAPTTDAWRARAEQQDAMFATGLEGVALLEAAHPAEEAAAIALMLREVLETPGQTAALVTPDRDLARRVASEMGRWQIGIDDSAGRPLSRTPAGAFLCLLADAADARFAPVPLLALLKHPLAAHGQTAADFRSHVRLLDRLCLRGPRPDPGLKGVLDAIERVAQDERQFEKHSIERVRSWFAPLAETLAPLEQALSQEHIDIEAALSAHVHAAERLAGDRQLKGTARLWRGSDGEAAAALVASLHAAAEGLGAIESGSYAPLFHALADEKSVRLPFGTHPRLAILGPLEARLQSFDLVILGGLNEGTWPRAAPIDPWFSRPMRKQLGLDPPERAMGLSSHDFAMLAAAPRVVITRSVKVEGTPTVASRWLQRVQQLAAGLGITLASAARYAGYVAQLNDAGPPQPVEAPAPRPPVPARPRSLRITEIETWLRDPYAIYARRVLDLEKLDALDDAVGPLERGTIVHDTLEAFLKRFPDALPDDSDRALIELADARFAAARIPKATLAIWRPRFVNAARWFVALERARRAHILHSFAERPGSRKFPSAGGDFELRGRADRIDQLKDGNAVVVDYKTGRPPTAKQVENLLAPQLPLEAAILAEGGFEGVDRLTATKLLYIQFSGGRVPGQEVPITDAEELALKAVERLVNRIAAFDNPDTPYVSRVMPFRADIPGDYDHLARVREWSLSGWAEDEPQ
jgi:ATP-dependent helicase/nuclease subunit B